MLRHDQGNFRVHKFGGDYKPKPHGFWLAKNWVAFFNIPLFSLRARFSRRSRSFSAAWSRSSDETTSVLQCAATHLFSVDFPTHKSCATCCRDGPLVSAIRTASLRNPSVLPVPMSHLLSCTLRYQRSGTKSLQVQIIAPARCLPRECHGRACCQFLGWHICLSCRAIGLDTFRPQVLAI